MDTIIQLIQNIPPLSYWQLGSIMGLLIMILILQSAARKIRRKKRIEPEIAVSTKVEQLKHDQKQTEEIDAESEKERLPRLSAQMPETDLEPETQIEDTDQPLEKPKAVSFFKRLTSQLSKTRDSISSGLEVIFSGKSKLDDDLLEDLEELLITADIGVRTANQLIEKLQTRTDSVSSVKELKTALKEEIQSFLPSAPSDSAALQKPHVIMVVGVNGVGKTTTIGKLAARFKSEGKSVLIVAADTFRAAAVEQLDIWAKRSGAEIIKHKERTDPAAVAYDGVAAGIARQTDIVIIDTAGRLHTKVNLMEELKKIKRSIGKQLPDAPHETLLILDATTGQNAISQTELFHSTLSIDGLIVTKLDGTAKGGIVVGICHSYQIPIKYIGIGEKIDDLHPFNSADFINALF